MTRETTHSAQRQEHLWIGGDGELSRLVTRLASTVGFQVTVFASPAQAAESVGAANAAPTLAVVLPSDVETQSAFLTRWIHLPLAFLALAAPRERRNSVFAHLIEAEVASRVLLERIVFPAAPGVGTLSVDELAICVVSHLIQNRFERRISLEAASRIRSPSLIT